MTIHANYYFTINNTAPLLPPQFVQGSQRLVGG
jgi:hypothetical protein